MKTKKFLWFILVLTLSFSPGPVLAFNTYFAENDVFFYDDKDTGSSGDENTICVDGITINGETPLPQSTITALSGPVNLAGKITNNGNRYTKAQEATGVPWQAIATLHYRENSSMSPEHSISNGSKLANPGETYVNVDGITVQSDATQDAIEAAEHFKSMAKSVYGVDVTQANLSVSDWGRAFLAYNRGSIYKGNNKDYTWSPYVMNGYNEAEFKYKMKWNEDSSNMPKNYSNWSRQTGYDANYGALTVFVFLTNGEVEINSQCISSAPIITTIQKLALSYRLETNVTSSNFQSYVKPDYVEAFTKYNIPKSFETYTDCGRFVSTVLKETGLDSNVPNVWVPSILEHFKKNPTLYSKVGDLSSLTEKNLQPGDIIVYSAHILFYTGSITDRNGQSRNTAQASLNNQTPNIRNLSIPILSQESGNKYEVYRHKNIRAES